MVLSQFGARIFFNLCRGWRKGAGHATGQPKEYVSECSWAPVSRTDARDWPYCMGSAQTWPRSCPEQQPAGTPRAVCGTSPFWQQLTMAKASRDLYAAQPSGESLVPIFPEFWAALTLNHSLLCEKLSFLFPYEAPYPSDSLPSSLANPFW